MSRPIITLTTDFGGDSPYVAQMKAVALGICRELTLVDVCHSIAPQDVLHGALVLADTVWHFPVGTIHVAVVDPGVGTARRLLAARIYDHLFIVPDNGLLSLLTELHPPQQLIALTRAEYWRSDVSATFHGRDVMAPVAAHLANGTALEALGTAVDTMQLLTIAQPEVSEREVRGECLLVDSFGNLIFNIDAAMLPSWVGEKSEVSVNGVRISRMVRTYGEASAGELVALLGSSGRLEVAKVNGNAAQHLRAARGSRIVLRKVR